MSVELQEFDSYEHFKRIVPRNPVDWEGRIVLYSALKETFFSIAFGTGDNLTDDDLDEGFDDYVMVEQYRINGIGDIGEIIGAARMTGEIDDGTAGLAELDGGQLLLKRKEWANGDIRRVIMEALDFAGYKLFELVPREFAHKDIIYIGADYDNMNMLREERT